MSDSDKHPEDPENVPTKKDLEVPGRVHPHTPQIIPGLNSPVPTIPLLGGRGSVPPAPRPAAPSGQQRPVETGASQVAGRAKLEVSAEQAARNQERFADLAVQRATRGLPVAGSSEDKATLARLDVNGKTYYGANGKAQDPRTPTWRA